MKNLPTRMITCERCKQVVVNDRWPRAKKYCSLECYTMTRIEIDYSYHAIHTWLWRNHRQDKTGYCNHCGSKRRTEWAKRIDRAYSRGIKDYIELCKPCHERYDNKRHDNFRGKRHTEESKLKIGQSVKKNRWGII